jgi:UDP-N-acetylmuramyl pentapeptide phosphotransferase/UDP-N-acetylglucosamine-1-phosphate transferase
MANLFVSIYIPIVVLIYSVTKKSSNRSIVLYIIVHLRIVVVGYADRPKR